MNYNGLQMTFSDPQMTLRPKPMAPLAPACKMLQKWLKQLLPRCCKTHFLKEENLFSTVKNARLQESPFLRRIYKNLIPVWARHQIWLIPTYFDLLSKLHNIDYAANMAKFAFGLQKCPKGTISGKNMIFSRFSLRISKLLQIKFPF